MQLVVEVLSHISILPKTVYCQGKESFIYQCFFQQLFTELKSCSLAKEKSTTWTIVYLGMCMIQ